MDAIVKMLEKHQPFFEKISRNVYLQAIKDGFLGCMPIVLTSSIFLLIATLPGVVGITLPQPLIDWCNKLYNFTMGVMGIMVAGTTAKNFTASMNRRMPAGKVLNDGSTMVAAQCSMLLLAVTQFTTKFNGSELSVFDCTSMGTRGLFSAYIAAFITVWVYKFCVSRDLTIKLPKEVPGAIAQNFRDIIPFGGAVIICGIIDVIVRNLMGVPFSELLIKLLSPLFTAAETYPGLILIQTATAFFWFIGVHGPSIVQPGIDPIRLANQAENLQVLLAGGHPAHSLTFNMSLVGEFGGTGAGTSAMLANAIKEGAAQTGENIASSAGAYGQHTAIMDQYDVIVLAPQVRSYYNDMKADTDRLGIKLLAPRGKEYIDLTRDPAGAIKWLRENLD